MNIVERIFSIEHTEKLVALSKKKTEGKLMRKNLRAHESDYTQKTHKNQNTFKSRLNGQPQLTIIQVAKSKSYNKRKSNYDFDRSMDGVSEELRPAAVATEQLMLQTIP
jgi:hypothetical protein